MARVWRPALVVAWCAAIFFASAQPDLRIASSDLLDTVLRKSAHAFVFGVLVLLASMTARQEGAGPRTAAVVALAFTLAYAMGDEWHQTFVHGRAGRPLDVAIDGAGAVAALALAGRRAGEAGARASSSQDEGAP